MMILLSKDLLNRLPICRLSILFYSTFILPGKPHLDFKSLLQVCPGPDRQQHIKQVQLTLNILGRKNRKKLKRTIKNNKMHSHDINITIANKKIVELKCLVKTAAHQ